MKPRILLAALPLTVLLAACKSPSDPGKVEEGEEGVSISYSGGVNGTFAAERRYVPGTFPNTQTFAAANRGADGTVEVTAYSQRGGSRFDIASVTIPAAVVGAVSVDRFCGADACPEVTLGLDLGQATGSVATHTCHLDTGTIRVTALSATRVEGTVSGSGVCLPGNGGDSVPFQVTSGTFGVDIRQG